MASSSSSLSAPQARPSPSSASACHPRSTVKLSSIVRPRPSSASAPAASPQHPFGRSYTARSVAVAAALFLATSLASFHLQLVSVAHRSLVISSASSSGDKPDPVPSRHTLRRSSSNVTVADTDATVLAYQLSSSTISTSTTEGGTDGPRNATTTAAMTTSTSKKASITLDEVRGANAATSSGTKDEIAPAGDANRASLTSAKQEHERSAEWKEGLDTTDNVRESERDDPDAKFFQPNDTSRITVLPHVFDRGKDGEFRPNLPALKDLDRVDDLLFYDNYTRFGKTNPPGHPLHRRIDPALPSREFLGFIRITKTASSSIIQFLQRVRNVRASNNFFRYEDLPDDKKLGLQSPACFYSHHSNLTSAPPPKNLRVWNCPHDSYSTLVRHFSSSLPYLHNSLIPKPASQAAVSHVEHHRHFGEPPSNHQVEENINVTSSVTTERRRHREVTASTAADGGVVDESTRIQITLNFFTIVRDPFERMVSFFHFWRKIYPDWLSGTPPNWIPWLIGGDLEAWMELRANTTVTRLDSADQSRYISHDVDRAIRLITTQPVVAATTHDATAAATLRSLRVVPLVSECFDASASLLVELFPNIFDEGSEKPFLESQSKVTNARERPKPDLGMLPVRGTNLTSLRGRAFAWFEDEYRFYDAAVRQFRELLARSSVDRKIVASCLRTLDGRQHERTALLLG